MSLTLTLKRDKKIVDLCGNNGAIVAGDIAFDDSYPTGGWAMDLSAYFPLEDGPAVVLVEPRGGYVFQYDHANKKLMAYMGNNDGSTDGPLVEVANEADLSTLVGTKFLAVGY